MSKHTPGPWRWELNLNSRMICLCGGVPRFDITVMDFVRWGMNSARCRVLKAGANSHMMLMENVEDYRVVVPGREHHSGWFQGIDHPDMNLIAAAPDLADVAHMVLNTATVYTPPELVQAATEALRKAGEI